MGFIVKFSIAGLMVFSFFMGIMMFFAVLLTIIDPEGAKFASPNPEDWEKPVPFWVLIPFLIISIGMIILPFYAQRIWNNWEKENESN